MGWRRYIVYTGLILSWWLPPGAGAAAEPVVVALFSGAGCSHCREAKLFLTQLQAQFPELTLKDYETWHNPENAALFRQVQLLAGIKAGGVPTLIIGKKIQVGFTGEAAPLLAKEVARCRLGGGCADPVPRILGGESGFAPLLGASHEIHLPFWGAVDSRQLSLPLFTILLGGLDSFNPCAIWVLTFLLTLLVYAQSRARMLLVGGIFVLTSGVVYFLFMSAWLNLFLLAGAYSNGVRIAIGLVAVGAGLINMKDFFWFGQGVSLAIPAKYKPTIIARMRPLIAAPGTAGVIAGTMVLAGFVNFIELLCTSGFPALYVRILTLQQLPTLGYYLYLALYNLVYVIPLALIVVGFVWTMRRKKLSEKEGRILKLTGGLMMALLGLLLLFKPELLFLG